jgi:hypothetical protein
MSHFSSVKTKIRNLSALERALKDLNYECTLAEEGQTVQVRGYQGQKMDAIGCIKASKTYDIGIVKTLDGTYEFVADWWGVETTRGVAEEDFIKQLTRRYSYHVIMDEVKKKGYTLETEETTEKDEIRIHVRSWS